MKVTLTLQQLRKVSTLTPEDFHALEELIRAKGIKEITVADRGRFSQLRSLNLVKGRRDKLWLKFMVDGELPNPFMGHRKKDSSCEIRIVAQIFLRLFKAAYSVSYGTLQPMDWAYITKLAKQFDEAELEEMVRLYFAQSSAQRVSVWGLYTVRHGLLRSAKQKHQEQIIYGGSDKSTESGEWETFDVVDEGGDTSSVSRGKSRKRTKAKVK